MSDSIPTLTIKATVPVSPTNVTSSAAQGNNLPIPIPPIPPTTPPPLPVPPSPSATSNATSTNASVYLNNPWAANTARKPRCRILSNGVQLPYPIDFNCTVVNNHEAARFDLTFPLYADTTYTIDWWGSQANIAVDIQAGFLKPSTPEDPDSSIAWNSLLQGNIDDIEIRPETGTVHCTGRDKTALFIDTKIYQSYINQTASGVATILAQGHGMTADVDPTTTLVGAYYARDHTKIADAQFNRVQTEWNMLTYLAKQENYDVYVTGNTLHFKQAVDPTQTNTGLWGVLVVHMQHESQFANIWKGAGSNVNNLMLKRSLSLAKDIKVTVRSYSSANGRGYSVTAERKGKASKNSEAVQEYLFYRPNISRDAAQKIANSLLADLSKHELVLDWEEPADSTLTTRSLVALLGTTSDFNTKYFIDSISYSFSRDSGFRMNVKAKNHSTVQTEINQT